MTDHVQVGQSNRHVGKIGEMIDNVNGREKIRGRKHVKKQLLY